jgi:16S rRNA (uracil1498-N3)-methyltransferase
MSERFFVTSPVTANRAQLDGAEAHHLTHVMRAKAGDLVTLFDGTGCEFEARIETVGKSNVELAVLSGREVDRESPRRLTLAVALPKGDRQQWLVEKAVELGVMAIVPLIAERSVAQPVASAIARLERMVIEASKQCGRNRLLEIGPPQRWTTFASESDSAQIRLLTHPGGKPFRSALPTKSDGATARGVIAAIGPEGGFTSEEVQHAVAAGWTTVDLGPRVLRVETAAVAIAAWCALNDQQGH